jgi:TolB-like protein
LLDLQRGGLYEGTRLVRLTALPFKVLTLLVVRHGCLVTKEEIFRVVWDDVAVTDDSIARAICTIRSALADSRSNPWFLETITGLGYRVIAKVAPQELSSVRPEDGGMTPKGSACLAVLPFREVGPSADSFAAGLSEAITINLAELSGLSVRPMSAVYQAQEACKQFAAVSSALQVDWLLDGCIQRLHSTLRVWVQLLGESGQVLVWGKSFDYPLSSELVLQEQIAARITESVLGRLGLSRNGRLWQSIDPVCCFQ